MNINMSQGHPHGSIDSSSCHLYHRRLERPPTSPDGPDYVRAPFRTGDDDCKDENMIVYVARRLTGNEDATSI